MLLLWCFCIARVSPQRTNHRTDMSVTRRRDTTIKMMILLSSVNSYARKLYTDLRLLMLRRTQPSAPTP